MNSVGDSGSGGTSSRKGRFKIIGGRSTKGGVATGKEMTSNPKVNLFWRGKLNFEASDWSVHVQTPVLQRAVKWEGHTPYRV